MASVIKRCKHEHPARCQCNWVVRYRDASGSQREESFYHDQKQVALDRKLKIEHDLRAGAPVFSRRGSDQTLGDWVTRWIEMHVANEKTKRTYTSALLRHIEPVLGETKLHRVDREAIRKLLLDTMPRSVGRSVVVTARTVLVASLNEAVAQHKLAENPATGIRLPNAGNQRAEFLVASYAQLTQLESELPAPWRHAVWLMRGCGLRIGEALAVHNDNIRGATLRVEAQVIETGKLGPLKHRKPGEFRDVPLPRYVAERIGTGEGYLFPEFVDGTTLTWKFRTSWRNAASGAGLPPKYTPHDLRHTWASIALASGVPITDVSRWLGHRDINLTHRVYGHLVPESAQRATEAIDAEFSKWREA